MIDLTALRAAPEFRALPIEHQVDTLRRALEENAAGPSVSQTPPSPSPTSGTRLDLKIQRAGLDPALVYGILGTEGSGEQSVSPKGAVGRFQVMPATAAAYGVSREELRNPDRNADAGLGYIKALTNRYSGYENWKDLVRAAYFSGPGNVRNGQIVNPNRTDGNLTVAQYVRRAGAQSNAWAAKRGGTPEESPGVQQGTVAVASAPVQRASFVSWGKIAAAYRDPSVQSLPREEQARVLANFRRTGKLGMQT